MKKQNLLGMYAMMAAMSNPEDYVRFEEYTKVKRPIKKVIPKNHKEFFYGENSVFALNKKNADRKAKRKGYVCT